MVPLEGHVRGAELQEPVGLFGAQREGLAKRLAVTGPAAGYGEQDYADRLEFELGVIIRMKYAGYFLIVSDFIKWAKSQSIPVGPGRGSGWVSPVVATVESRPAEQVMVLGELMFRA